MTGLDDYLATLRQRHQRLVDEHDDAGLALIRPVEVLALLDCAELLGQVAPVFREYEAIHTSKGTPDGQQKAARNGAIAKVCEQALSRLSALASKP